MTPRTPPHNASRRPIILLAASVGVTVYAGLGAAGDLRSRPWLLAGCFALLSALMLGVWWRTSRVGVGRGRLLLGAALLFRVAAAWGPPALSDDVYRFVWDGRVQLAGYHPYAHAPLDPELAALRDDEVWPRINHPELRTIYPPLAEMLFLGLCALGAGTVGFKLALGLLDFAVVIVLWRLLGRSGAPRQRVVLYAWNPLAVMEIAGSGHVEPLGVALMVAALALLASPRRYAGGASLAAAVHAKLLPAVLIPSFVRRLRPRETLVLAAVLVGLGLPYAIGGPAVGSGLFAYAGRWEHNASLYPLLREGIALLDPTPALKGWIATAQQRLSAPQAVWDFLYGHVWPRNLARLLVAVLAAGWVGVLTLSRRRREPVHEALLVIGGVLLLSPTVHPWYLLWLLPLAAARLHWGWLGVAMAAPLTYVAGGADVPLAVRVVEYAPLVVWAAWRLAARRRALC